MNKIEIKSHFIKYGERNINNRNDVLRIDYISNLTKKTKIKVELEDNIFNTEKQDMTLEHASGMFFCTFLCSGFHHVNNGVQITDSFIHPLKISFIDVENNKILLEEIIDIRFVDKSLRGHNPSKKVAWVFGDSHIGHIAQKINYNEFNYDDLYIKPISKVGLSCNRFSNSDFLNYLSHFPIIDNDIILLNFGEIDCRMAVHKKNYYKGISKSIILKGVLHNYLNAINKIRLNYPNNESFIILPNQPFKDEHITSKQGKEEFLFNSNETDRKLLHNEFVKFLYNMSELNNKFKIIDMSEYFEGENKFIDRQFLRNEDCHMKSNKQYFDFLYQKIKDI